MKARKRVVTGAVQPGRRRAPKRSPTVRRIRSAIVPVDRASRPASGESLQGVGREGVSTRGSPASGTIDLSLSLGSSGRSSLRLQNPILIAAGCAGYGVEVAGALGLDRLGGMVTRTTTLRPRDGAPPPRLVERPNALLWATGLPNPGLDAVVERFAPGWPRLGTSIIVSVAGDGVGELVDVARRLEEVPGVAALELNLGELRPDPAGPSPLASAVGAVRRATERPLLVKLPWGDDPRRFARAVVDAGADALVGPGDLRARALAAASGPGLARHSALGAGRGFVAGPALLPIGLDVVAELAAAVPVPIVAVGGVRTLVDVLDYLAAGAMAVGIGTAALADPTLPARLVDELRAACLATGLADLRALLAEVRRRGPFPSRSRTLAP